MIYWFTGQPGHGKTLCAIQRALEYKDEGRVVYVCNVRDFDYEKTGMLPMTPEQFRDWPNFLPDGAVCLVDEAYEHGMLPKRPPSAKVPEHVERLATHRHRGLDFIFVCQSPDKQVDGFVHDLIERHIHVRRRFGTKYQHLREFDRYEKSPEKAHPLVLRRQRLPKRPMGTYKSTEMDTTERKIPWYYIALVIGLPLGLGFMYWTFAGLGKRLAGDATPKPAASGAPAQPAANGAQATVAAGAAKAPMTATEYMQQFIPRVASQPWSAPAYDAMPLSPEPPRLFCMIGGDHQTGSCTCLTEQGTRYRLAVNICRSVALNGQYEPYYTVREAHNVRDGYDLGEQARRDIELANRSRSGEVTSADVAPYGGVVTRQDRAQGTFPEVASSTTRVGAL